MSKAKTNTNTIEPEVRENDSRVCIKLNRKLRSKIKYTAKELSSKYYPYDALCWALAEFQLIFEKGKKKYSEHEVIERAESIFESLLDYDDLCRFIANLKIYLEEAKLYP